MKEIDIYTNFDAETGITYVGADEVNDPIKHGARVISIMPAVRLKECEGDKEHYQIFGWMVKVIIDDSTILDS